MKSILRLALAFLAAQSAVAIAAGEDGAGVAFGPVTAYPSLGLTVGNDDNLFLSDANKKSSSFEILSPAVRLQSQKGANKYSLSYRADMGRYNNSSADNYVDQKFIGGIDLNSSIRTGVRISPQYLIGHEARGSTYGAGTAVPNEWHEAGIAGTVTYGAEGAKGRIQLDGAYANRQYDNNRVITTAYDKTTRDLGATFYYRVMPKTSLLFQAGDKRIDYKQVGSLLNGNERRYLFGATWEATAQTTGIVKIGNLRKKFDSGLPSFSGTSWNGAIVWSPRDYSRVRLDISRDPVETTFAGSEFILDTNSNLDWTYDLTDRLSSRLGYGHLTEDFKGATRYDKTDTYRLGADYRMRRWLKVKFDYMNSAKNSNANAASYKRNIFMVTLDATL